MLFAQNKWCPVFNEQWDLKTEQEQAVLKWEMSFWNKWKESMRWNFRLFIIEREKEKGSDDQLP